MKYLNLNLFKPKNLVIPDSATKTKDFTYVEQPAIIAEADAAQYKRAIVAARAEYIQQRSILYDAYSTAIDFDAHLKGLIDRRLLNTAGRKLEYVINDEAVDGVDTLLQSPAFEKLIRDFIMSKVFWGMGLFEFDSKKYGDKEFMSYQLIPIKHVDPFMKIVRHVQYSTSQFDTSYENLKNVIFVGDGKDFGLLQQLALIALYKRSVMNDWASYSQLAGTNFREVIYQGEAPDAATREQIRRTVQGVGSGTTDYSKLDMHIETRNQTSSSQNQLFENYIKYLDDTMTKLVLGQTMTSEDGSSRSQAEVHERTQDSIFDADAKAFIDFMNYDFYEMHQIYNIPAGGMWRFAESGTLKQKQQIELDIQLKQLGYLFTQEDIKQRYGL